MRPILLIIFLFSFVSSAPAGAQEEIERLVVTGTRLEDSAERLPNTMSVVDLVDIEARNNSSLVDLLRAQPGLHLTQPGGRAGVASLFLRGGEPNSTVFLLDGIRVNDLNNTRGGSFDLATLGIDEVERIEIVRGPQSSIYGSDALSGVVNVITRGGSDKLSGGLTGEIGGYDYHRANVELTGPIGDAGGFSVRAGTLDDGEPVPGGTFELNTVSGKFEWRPGANFGLNAYARFADSEGTTFPEDSGGPELAVIREVDQKQAEDLTIGADFDWRFASGWALAGLANHYEREDETLSPGIAPGVRDPVPPNGAHSELERSYASLRLSATPAEPIDISFGFDFQREQGRSDGFVEFFPGFEIPTSFDLERDILGVFGELRYAVSDQLTLLGSLRHDDPDGSSGQTTGKLGGLLSLNDDRTQIRANWGTGFKLPSFFALGNPLVGNPGLKPEESESFDLGLRQSFFDRRLTADITLFYNDYTNLIDFDSDLFTNVNRAAVETRGLELSIDYAVTGQLDLLGHATYTDIDPADSDVTLRQRPEWRGGADLRWRPAEAWLMNLSWLYVGSSFDSSVPTGGLTLASYNRVDLNLSWDPTKYLRLALAVDNLLDEDYEEAIGFPAPGIRGRFTLRFRFGG